MNDQTPIRHEDNPAPRDDNKPPSLVPPPVDALTSQVKEEHHEILQRGREVQAALEKAPTEINDDDVAKKVTDLLKAAKTVRSQMEATRKIENEPWDTLKKAVDAVFKNPWNKLKEAEDKLREILTAYNDAQAEKRRKEEERKAEEARIKAENERKAAEEAERRQQEAERKRIEEEEAARKAEEEKLAAIEAAKKAKEEEERARQERIRLEKEAAEKRRQDAAYDKGRTAGLAGKIARDGNPYDTTTAEGEKWFEGWDVGDKKRADEEQAETDRLAKIEADRDERKRQEAREAEEAEAQKRIDDLKKQEEQAKETYRDERGKEKDALDRRRTSEDAIRETKAEEREAARDVRETSGSAQKLERESLKHEKRAGGAAHQTRSDWGTLGTNQRRWTYTVKDYNAVDMEKLRPFIAREAIDAAVHRYMQTVSNKETLTTTHGLEGVEFFQDSSAMVR